MTASAPALQADEPTPTEPVPGYGAAPGIEPAMVAASVFDTAPATEEAPALEEAPGFEEAPALKEASAFEEAPATEGAPSAPDIFTQEASTASPVAADEGQEAQSAEAARAEQETGQALDPGSESTGPEPSGLGEPSTEAGNPWSD